MYKKISKAIYVIGLGIFILFVGSIFFLFVLYCYALYDSIGKPVEIQEQRIPIIYQKAGLKGKIVDLKDTSNIHKARLEYIYREKNDDKEWSYDISVVLDKNEKLPSYTYHDIVDLYTGKHGEESSSGNDYLLFSEFFDQALYNNQKMRDYQAARIKSLEERGLQKVQLELESSYDYLDDENKQIFNKEMKKDLDEANKNGYVPVYGIDTLDPLKYWSLSSSYMIISTDSNIDQFLEVINQIDPQEWQPGYYRVEERQGLVYANFHVNEKGIWTNITDEESNSAE